MSVNLLKSIKIQDNNKTQFLEEIRLRKIYIKIH